MNRKHGRAAGMRSRVRRPIRALGATLACVSALALAAPPAPASIAASEAKVKAAFLLNFTRFVDWPGSAFASGDAPFVICVLGEPAFAATAREVIGDNRVKARSVTVESRSSLDGAESCHIFFLPSSGVGQQQALIQRSRGRSIFTISESDGFAQMGGIANFVRADKKLRLAINRKAADKSRLKVSARLLRIADLVS